MSGYGTPLSPPPVVLPPLRAGETDGRYVDCTPDLGPVGDTFPGIGAISVAIARQDGATPGANDLQIAGAAWPNTLDSTNLIPTIGLTAPNGAAGVTYVITLSTTTAKGRLWIRDCLITVAATLG